MSWSTKDFLPKSQLGACRVEILIHFFIPAHPSTVPPSKEGGPSSSTGLREQKVLAHLSWIQICLGS